MTQTITIPSTDATVATVDRIKPYNPELLTRLEGYMAANGAQNTQIAKELGIHPAAISRYRNGRPEGNVARLESLLEDLLKGVEIRKGTSVEYFTTSVTSEIARRADTIRKTNDVGLLHGPAGCGKTSGGRLYAADNTMCVRLELTTWARNTNGLEQMLFSALETRSYKRGRRIDWSIDRLAESNRLLIIDNAQRLTKRAVGWVFDFHDLTGCPILLIGNTEVLELIESNDQHYSRIGMVKEVRLRGDEEECARRMIDRFAPGQTEQVIDLAVQVAQERGHLRSLRKQILLANEIYTMPKHKGDYRRAFETAHTQLIRNYRLA